MTNKFGAIMQLSLSRRFAVMCGAAISMSACVGLSSPTQDASFLSCDRLTRNALGDIDPVPSPDGQYVAYRRMTTASPEVGELHYLQLDHPRESRVLLGASDFLGGASWSPDSEWISYTAFERRDPGSAFLVTSVYKVDVRTNEKVRLVDGRTISDIGEYTSWTTRNEIYFAAEDDAFYVIDPHGGSPRRSLGIDMEFGHEPLHLAADVRGKSIAFSVDSIHSKDAALRSRSGIWLADLEAGQIVQLTHESSDSFPVWQDAETILFLRESPQGELRAQARLVAVTETRAQYSLHSITLSTGKVTPVGTQGINYSISAIPGQTQLFAATANRWDLSGNDFNIFRGFSIARCTITRQFGAAFQK